MTLPEAESSFLCVATGDKNDPNINSINYIKMKVLYDSHCCTFCLLIKESMYKRLWKHYPRELSKMTKKFSVLSNMAATSHISLFLHLKCDYCNWETKFFTLFNLI